MIHQFAELGQYYRKRERVADDLALYTQDPSQKFRTTIVLLLVFSDRGFERAQIEQYDDSKRLQYLYRPGPPNRWDATPTCGLRRIGAETQTEFDEKFSDELRKKLARLAGSLGEALRNNMGDSEENVRLCSIQGLLEAAKKTGEELFRNLLSLVLTSLPPEKTRTNAIVSKDAIISIAWQEQNADLKRVGDFQAFKQALVKHGRESASTKKGIRGRVSGKGQCSICGTKNVSVSGLLQIPNFKIYTLDKRGSVSGGFDPLNAWRNFPACRNCCDLVDFAGERVKKNLSFDYYGFKYLFLPSPVQPARTSVYDFLDDRLEARVSPDAQKRLTAAEDEILYFMAKEKNLLQVDLLFYRPDPNFFRPALYVPGLVPTRFRTLFYAKYKVDRHPWLNEPSSKPFTSKQFTFGSLRSVFPQAHQGGSSFDDDFLSATRAALELRPFCRQRILQIGMRWVQQDYRDGKAWAFRLADLFRCLLFFEFLTGSNHERSEKKMNIDYGSSEQAARVRAVLDQASGKLRVDAAAQAAFLVGACCSRIEVIQQHVRGASPFTGKLKGFRLNQADICRLFVAAKDKSKAYGPEEEKKVSSLLECAAAALAATPERWPLSGDEISFYFALGHALRSRFAKDNEPDTNQER